MEKIAKSGLYYPNKIARIAILGLEEVVGRNGMKVIFNMAGLPDLIENLPPENLARDFDFADFSAINGALEEMYGPRGGRVLALRAGKICFDGFLKSFIDAAGAEKLLSDNIPLNVKMSQGMPVMAKIFSETSDQLTTVVEKEDHFISIVHCCPVCYGRHTEKPACSMALGLIQASLNWVSGGKEFSVVQRTAKSVGDETCSFEISKEPIS